MRKLRRKWSAVNIGPALFVKVKHFHHSLIFFSNTLFYFVIVEHTYVKLYVPAIYRTYKARVEMSDNHVHYKFHPKVKFSTNHLALAENQIKINVCFTL
jgi:hypothetical protein